MFSYYKNKGFTLIEGMVTIAVASILAAMSIPSYNNLMMRNEVSSLSNELNSALRLAQNEAVRRGGKVTLVPRTSSEQKWLGGWDIFEDLAHLGVKNTNEELIRTHSLNTLKSTINTDGDVFSSYIIFLPDGTARGNMGTTGSFTVCPSNGKKDMAYTIDIERSGNISGYKGALRCPF